MAAYVMIKDGAWVNTAEWDGVSPWARQEGTAVIPFDDGVYGWDGKWTYDGVAYEQKFDVAETPE